ncbi:PIN domain-containing protein [Thermococcus waiotapuensis]|uniref:PIN domain-containing protein n=1 Tax=Thermococcus waiotapuensis TaxID=90909 RepID=A0AAE4NU11_9EURY|nr:PIN domain-containing protein [Thermococcus waiotapuensis]MDV3103346.1 PIN domain-containing protein [Thermococcus waiotapuensis]
MIRVYLDTNVLLNVWFKEENPKTGEKLWNAPLQILELVENGKIEGVVSIFTLMESAQVFKRNKLDPERVKEIEDVGIEVYIPSELTLIDAFSFQLKLGTDPYDSVALASALASGCDVLITRDEDFRKKAEEQIRILSPEEFLEWIATSDES